MRIGIFGISICPIFAWLKIFRKVGYNMKKYFKRFLIILIAIFAVFSLSACGKKADSSGKFEIVVVNEKGSTILDKTISFEKGDNLVDLLKADRKVKLNGNVTEYGFYVTGVCDIEASTVGENYYWRLSVDDEISLVGISSVELRDGMKITFELIDWTTETWE